MNKHNITKILSGIFTIMVVSLLVLAGPAEATLMELETQKEIVEQGSTAIFRAEITDVTLADDDTLTFGLSGPQALEYVFSIDGEEISGCDDVKIHARTEETDYGYGYGTEIVYKYLVQVKTTGFPEGTYTPTLTLNMEPEESVQGEDFEIVDSPR